MKDTKVCNTVQGIWDEYTTKIRPYNVKYPPPTIRSMAPWRIKSRQQDKLYSRRKLVWEWIEGLIRKGETESGAVSIVSREIGTDSMTTIADKIRKASKLANQDQ